MAKKYLSVLEPPSASDLFEGAQITSVYYGDGQWYPCTIEKVIEEEAKDDLPAQVQYQVRFKQYNNKITVPLDFVKLSKEQKEQNEKRKVQIEKEKKEKQEEEEESGFCIPEHLRMKRNDTDKVKLQKRQKVKAMKYEHKTQV